MSATLWARSGSYEFDDNGERAPAATAEFFDSGTSTPRAVYQDSDLSDPHANPVLADGNGRWPAVYLPFGDYKYTLKTSGGTTLITIDGISNDAPTDPSDTVDPNAIFQTGDTIISIANESRTGFVRCNGRTIGSAASTATERANSDCEDLFAFIWNKSTTLRALVSGGSGASAAADFAANKRIPTPDYRSAGLIGFDDMGNTAAALAGSAPVVSGSAILAGSLIGANTHVITEAQLAAHTHAVSITSGGESVVHTHAVGATTTSDGAHSHTINISDPGHLHTQATGGPSGTKANEADAGSAGAQYVNAAAASTVSNTTGITASSVSTGAHTHTISTTSGNQSIGHTHEVSGTSGSKGSGTAHNIMARSAPVTVLMKL